MIGPLDPSIPVTPEMAMDSYRPLVEAGESDPVILARSGEYIYRRTLTVPEEGIQGVLAEAVAELLLELRGPADQVVMAAEAWVRSPDDESLDEAVIVTYADPENNWTAVRPFVRTREGVRWLGGMDVSRESEGPVLDILRALVSFPPEHLVCDCEQLPVNRWRHPDGTHSDHVIGGDAEADASEYRRLGCVSFQILCPTCGQVYSEGTQDDAEGERDGD